MRYAFFDRENVNLITTDWYKGADLPLYAAGNTRLVGAQVAELIRFLVKNAHTSADRFYIVGFGHGAHVGGYAGKSLGNDNHTLGRITGKKLNLHFSISY